LENLEGLTEVGTLGLQSLRKNSCGAAKKQAKARLAEAPTGDSCSGQTQASRASQPQNLQKPSTSGAQRKTQERTKINSVQLDGNPWTGRATKRAQPNDKGRLGALPRVGRLKANSNIACCAHAIPLPCHSLIHTCHAAPLPCSDSAVSFVKVRVLAGNIRTASPTV